jgi:hypothetical protein
MRATSVTRTPTQTQPTYYKYQNNTDN